MTKKNNRLINLSTKLNDIKINEKVTETEIEVEIPDNIEEGFLECTIPIEHATADDFILFPACCYKGNQFLAKPMDYPSMYYKNEAKIDMPIMVTEVPRLHEDGRGCISVSVGDLSVPCIGIYQHTEKKAMFLFLEQQYRGMNLGVSYEQGEICIHVPANRRKNNPNPKNEDRGLSYKENEKVTIPYKWYQFSCADIMEFYEFFFDYRKCMELPSEASHTLTLEEAWEIHEGKFNKYNYNDYLKTYTVGCEYDESFWGRYQIWQPGWTGGALSSYPLMKLGSQKSVKRGLDTLDFLFSTQQESGYFIGLIDGHGNHYGDGFAVPDTPDWHMVRKSADILYFMFKHFEVMKEKGIAIPETYLRGTRRLADAFVKNWKKYGQLGQYVSHDTGEIVVGGSTAGALVSAGLIQCAQWFQEFQYATIAEEIGRKYYMDYTCEGYTVGGPGEILQNPDSESAFLLLESFVVLYEYTKDDFWLTAAKQQAAQCSSWVVAYNYQFPETSEFGRLGIKTVGSVFANVQNKHSAPGICTLSGDSLLKLYRFTGEEKYLQLITDIAVNIFQYMSTEARPIYSRDIPPRKCPQGYINERVNLSDWEGPENVGSIFYGSTWAETSSMLTIAELSELLIENGL